MGNQLMLLSPFHGKTDSRGRMGMEFEEGGWGTCVPHTVVPNPALLYRVAWDRQRKNRNKEQ